MRELFLMRHAKSSWDDPTLADFDRPLNGRGREDAPLMGRFLKKSGIKPDLIVSSPARRAKKTARIVAEELGYDKDKIRFVEGVYEASLQSLIYTVCGFPDEAKRVLLVGHNPGMSELANALGDVVIDHVPTAGVVGIAFDTRRWGEACRMKGHTVLFEYPKRLKNEDVH